MSILNKEQLLFFMSVSLKGIIYCRNIDNILPDHPFSSLPSPRTTQVEQKSLSILINTFRPKLQNGHNSGFLDTRKKALPLLIIQNLSLHAAVSFELDEDGRIKVS